MFLVILFNACLRLCHYPTQWKIAQIVMILKPGKQIEEVSSYRPISLLPLIGKLFERVILNRLRPHLDTILPEHQFGFRQKHATIEQIHRLTDTISHALETKKYCSAVFLDISQAFDRVWHDGLLFKIKKYLPHSFYFIMKSYLSERCFEVKLNNIRSDLYKIRSGVPQGSILGPVLYLIFTADIPTDNKTFIATYADDTAIMSVHENAAISSSNLQKHITEVEKWMKTWRIKANQSKSAHVTFTLRKGDCPPITLNGEQIPHSDAAKYLGMHLDRRLTWKKHIWSKRKCLGTKLREMYWLIGGKSQSNNESKMAIYKSILKPVWTYGIELWGTASNSNIEILERFQTKAIRSMFNIPKCIQNKYILQDLRLKTVKQEIAIRSLSYQLKLAKHVNTLASELSGTGSTQHTRLRRNSVPNLSLRFTKEW
ncbi:RNA-directed DNA polymerase from mobile element jockey [Eumeta japonica]|uniref:RNA-directed DNA polymerase from mobile element jockey n=1 Tax=Eumeta variegata TaxID=151549 RepID=A0A4C1VTV9_EUMVA|nr:RNA-directed DNA polymerase from mobile element jockey [Eumeta japonica]